MLFIIGLNAFSHTINYKKEVLRHWFIQKENKFIEGSFSMYKNGKVYIEDAQNSVFSYSLTSLSKPDQAFALQKEQKVIALNEDTNHQNSNSNNQFTFKVKIVFVGLFLLLLSIFLHRFSDKKKTRFVVPIICFGALFTVYSFAEKTLSITDPAFVTSAFAPFASSVSTTYDANYFYVNSTGIPNHTMMVGISNHGWQQQVPISKCYINTSHWTIPLNPVLAATPVPVSASHFLKGAIAMAANGVPIFNYHTNTGVDSFLDGQLDNYGGHCGRGDDYHYHTAPLHLITLGQTTYNLPIAFGLDGFAVYGTLEPDGSPMEILDANHGHFGSNGVYHYHGTATAPYMIGKMVGQVTEDANLQIIPQPQGSPVRTENWTPLNGALITSCIANATNGYNTLYSLNGVSGYATNYTATTSGLYTFQYITPTGSTTVNYNGPALCVVPNLSNQNFISIEKNITIYPIPATDILQISLGNQLLENDVKSISIYDVRGNLISKNRKYVATLDIKSASSGTYFVKIQFSNLMVTKKFIIK